MDGAINLRNKDYISSPNVEPTIPRVNSKIFENTVIDNGKDHSRNILEFAEAKSFPQFVFTDPSKLYTRIVNDSNGGITPNPIVANLVMTYHRNYFPLHLTSVYDNSPKSFIDIFYYPNSNRVNNISFSNYEAYYFVIAYIVYVNDHESELVVEVEKSIVDWAKRRFTTDLRNILQGPSSNGLIPYNFLEIYHSLLSDSIFINNIIEYSKINRLSSIRDNLIDIEHNGDLAMRYNQYDKSLDEARKYTISISDMQFLNTRMENGNTIYDASTIEIGSINKNTTEENRITTIRIVQSGNEPSLIIPKQVEILFKNSSVIRIDELSISRSLYTTDLSTLPISYLVFPGIHTEPRTINNRLDRKALRIAGRFELIGDRFVFKPQSPFSSFVGPRTNVTEFSFLVDGFGIQSNPQLIDINRENLFQHPISTGRLSNTPIPDSISVMRSKLIDESAPEFINDEVDLLDFKRWLSLQQVIPIDLLTRINNISLSTSRDEYITIVKAIQDVNGFIEDKFAMKSLIPIRTLLTSQDRKLVSLVDSLLNRIGPDGQLTTVEDVKGIIADLSRAGSSIETILTTINNFKSNLSRVDEKLTFNVDKINGLVNGHKFLYDQSKGILRWIPYSGESDPLFTSMSGLDNDITLIQFFDPDSLASVNEYGHWIYSKIRHLLQRIQITPSKYPHYNSTSSNIDFIHPPSSPIIAEVDDLRLTMYGTSNIALRIGNSYSINFDSIPQSTTIEGWVITFDSDSNILTITSGAVTFEVNWETRDVEITSQSQVPMRFDDSIDLVIDESRFGEFQPILCINDALSNYWNPITIDKQLAINFSTVIDETTFNNPVIVNGEYRNVNSGEKTIVKTINEDVTNSYIVPEGISEGVTYYDVNENVIYTTESATKSYIEIEKWNGLTRTRYKAPIYAFGLIAPNFDDTESTLITTKITQPVDTRPILYFPFIYRSLSTNVMGNLSVIRSESIPIFTNSITSFDENIHQISTYNNLIGINGIEKIPFESERGYIRNASQSNLLFSISLL